MNIRQKMVSIVISGILLSAVSGATLIYKVVQQKILTNQAANLEAITEKFTIVASQRISESEPKLKALESLLSADLKRPAIDGEIKTFNRLFEKNSDGVWRNRKEIFNGELEAGLFLPSSSKETDLQKIQHTRIKRIMDVFGASANRRMENVWYLSPQRSEIIFDKTYPNFAFDQKADNDYTQTPWVTYTTPEKNPKKELRFTPPLFDPVPKVWMVSAIYPLYVNDQWMGSIGEDMALTGVLEFMFTTEQLYAGTEHFLIDTQDNFVLAGAWQKELEASSTNFKIDFSKEPSLPALFKARLTNKPHLLSDSVTLHGKRYIAIGMLLEPLGWHYYMLAPVDEIMASTRALFVNLTEMILLIAVLNGLLVFMMSGRTITSRIRILTHAMNNYGNSRHFPIAKKLQGKDEISQAALAFDSMANDIEDNIIELNKRTEQLQSVFDVSPSGYLLVNHQQQILLVNKVISRITGLEMAELMLMSENSFWEHLASQTDNPDTTLKLLHERGLQRLELIKPRQISLLGGMQEIQLQSGQLLGKLYFLHDITKEEEANRVKSEFLTHAAHELRTPLSTIHGYAELLHNGMLPPQIQPEVIESVYQQSTWLISMINEFIDLNRIEERAGTDFEIATYPVSDLIQSAITEFKLPEGRAPIIYKPTTSIFNVNVDESKFRKVLLNVLDNAFKFSPEGGNVSVNVLPHAQEKFVEIEIADNGIGLNDEEVARVFERFYRVDKSGAIPGAGLGLSLAKEIMFLLGGDIRIVSTPNIGSSVFIKMCLH